MSEEITTDSLSLIQRVVLTSIVEAERAGETPVESIEIKQRAQRQLRSVETSVMGEPAERDIMRALNGLGAESYLTEMQPSTSPTGKGRPLYELDTDPETIIDALVDDQRLESVLEELQE